MKREDLGEWESLYENADREYNKVSYEPIDEDIIDSLPSEYQQGDLKEDMVDSDVVVQ